MQDQLLDTWAIANRVNLYVLDAIPPEALGIVPDSKGRSVGQMFAHIHNVRLMWLEVAAPELVDGLAKIEKSHYAAKDHLRHSLEASGQAIEGLLKKAIDAKGKVKGFKPHVVAFMGYLIAHDAYHRGEIGIVLKQIGHPLDNKVSYGMWEWGVR
jgi:uncharacterized damage-inducible protein DinB